MKPGALILTLEMMRRAEEAETGEKTSKKRFSEENSASHDRLIEAGLVLDYSIDSDLVQDVLSGAKGLRIRAECRAGELLKDLQKAVGGRPSAKTGNAKEPVSNAPLSDLGISKRQSSDWQRLASVPQEIFDDELKLTKSSIA